MDEHEGEWQALAVSHIVMARSWGVLAVKPIGALYDHGRRESIGRVFGVVTFMSPYGLVRGAGGSRAVLPTVFQGGALSAFLADARKLCDREIEEACLQEEAGARVSYRWLASDASARDDVPCANTPCGVGTEPVLAVRCAYGDVPVWRPKMRREDALPRPPWWLGRMPCGDDTVSFAIKDLLATRAQLEKVIRAVADLIEANGSRRL